MQLHHEGHVVTALTHLQRRLLDVQDAKLRRCGWCGEWVYDRDDCRVCAAPAKQREQDVA
jgi:recombinational DNA repair protein RecR